MRPFEPRPCGGRRQMEPWEPSEEFRTLAAKYNQLAEIMRSYVVEAPLERNIRNENATRMARILERIVGGVETAEGEYPACCLVGVRHRNGTHGWFCSGVLIADRMVLTAGHCIDPTAEEQYAVALNAMDEDRLGDAELRLAKKAEVHPNYLSRRTNDIAALILTEPAQTPSVQCCSSEDLNSASEVTLVGFGNDNYAGTRGFGIKRKVSVDVTAVRRDPADDLDGEEIKFGFESDYEFVAGGEGYDSCNGDSGGPAYAEISGQRRVAGLTSRATRISSRPCGDGGIYTRTDFHFDFVKEMAAKHGIPL